MNPQTRPLLAQPDFMAILRDLGNNPSNMSNYLQDPRLQQALSVGLGINMMSGDDFKKGDTPKPPSSTAAAQATQDGIVESDDEMPVCKDANVQLEFSECLLLLVDVKSRLVTAWQWKQHTWHYSHRPCLIFKSTLSRQKASHCCGFGTLCSQCSHSH